MPIVYGWGASPWGSGMGGGVGAMSILDAYAISERQLILDLSAAPRAFSTIGVGDALNPLTWSVKRLDTNAELVVLSTRMVTSTQVELYTLTKFSPMLISHRVTAIGLLDSAGAQLAPPNTWDWTGCQKDVPAEIVGGLSDFANKPTNDQSFTGVILVDSSGDYAHDSGQTMLRKLVMRRLIMAPGEFFFLDQYGLGLRVKETLRDSDIPKLQAAAQGQLLREPEFSRVSVQMSLTTDGVLNVKVTAVLRQDNSQVRVNVPVPTSLVAL